MDEPSPGTAPASVTSSRNPGVKLARRLQRGRVRAETGLVLLEGRRLVAAALDADVEIEALYVTDPAEPLAHGVRRASTVPEDILGSIATTLQPQGVVAVAKWAPQPVIPPGAARILVLCGVGDPGNAGNLVRTAAGFGWDAVVLTRGSCDPTNPKLLRAAAGATFHVPVVGRVEVESALAACRGAAATCVHGAPRGGIAPEEWRKSGEPLALWLGSEAHGLDPATAAVLDAAVTLPLAPGCESLNVAAAGAVLLWELRPG